MRKMQKTGSDRKFLLWWVPFSILLVCGRPWISSFAGKEKPERLLADLAATLEPDSVRFEARGFTPDTAWASGNKVVYRDAGNRKAFKASGKDGAGSSSWQTNNPGNIKYTKYTKIYDGVIGKKGSFCVFATPAQGLTAHYNHLVSAGYRDSTLSAAISKWCPPVEGDGVENPTADYIKFLVKQTKLDSGKKIRDFSPAEQVAIVGTMLRFEGWKRGETLIEPGSP
ncbi:MAG: hypothetical protein K9G62_02000 [Alphaproteobacteria bacterium]|nr:hypothetical protein [Alphaproteobacteria bacterium]